MRLLKKIFITVHRYMGMFLCLVLSLWFLSAFVMIYTGGLPSINQQMRISAASPLQLEEVTLSPAAAASEADITPSAATLHMFLGRPAYELSAPGRQAIQVFADNGEVFEALNENDGQKLAASYLDVEPESLVYTGLVDEVDQWTLTLRRQLPFYHYRLSSDPGTEVYVSRDDQRVSLVTTSRSRMLAWLGVIPHWIYFRDLRLNQPLWYDLVVWLSGLSCIVVLIGLVLGAWQWRKKVKPFSVSRSIPYHGLMRWHYILGIAFGVITLTWTFSGLLSMEPFEWTNRSGLEVNPNVYSQGRLDLTTFPDKMPEDIDQRLPGTLKEVDYLWIQGRPWYRTVFHDDRDGQDKRERGHQPYRIAGAQQADSLLIGALTGDSHEGFEADSLVQQLEYSVDASVSEYSLLREYDNYYYSRGGQLPLPVLRIKFDDPDQSWVYVDPEYASLLTMVHKSSRIERWLYNGLHSLDFSFWYHSRPLWDIGVILLLSGGLLLCLSGVWLGVRRLCRDLVSVGRLLLIRNKGVEYSQ